MADSRDWSHDIHERLTALGVVQVAYVPDAGFARLIELCRADAAMTCVPLTTEEEGIALLTGAWLGGQRGVLLMQSSGVGNCLNMLAMVRTCTVPLLTLVTMRGEWAEFNPWQVPMGQATAPALAMHGGVVHRVETADEVAETVAAAGRLAFSGQTQVSVLIAQRLIGAKSFED